MKKISITHKPSGRVRVFDYPQEAHDFVALAKKKGIPTDDLIVDSWITLSVFADHVPPWVATLVEQIEKDFPRADGKPVVPRIHWINKKNRGSSVGHTYWKKRGDTIADRIAISAKDARFVVYEPGAMTMGETSRADQKGVLLHEIAHAMHPHGEHHGRAFFRLLFVLVRRYMNSAEEKHYIAREARYIKSSRYWYAEMYNIQEVLSQYRQPQAAAIKKTDEERTLETIESMFGEEND